MFRDSWRLFWTLLKAVRSKPKVKEMRNNTTNNTEITQFEVFSKYRNLKHVHSEYDAVVMRAECGLVLKALEKGIWMLQNLCVLSNINGVFLDVTVIHVIAITNISHFASVHLKWFWVQRRQHYLWMLWTTVVRSIPEHRHWFLLRIWDCFRCLAASEFEDHISVFLVFLPGYRHF